MTSNFAKVVFRIVVASIIESVIISVNIGVSSLAFVVKALALFFRDTFCFFHDKNNVDEASDIAAAEKKPN